MSQENVVDAWRRIIIGEHKSWVVFTHGTCVVLPSPEPTVDLASQAVEILREYGPVQAGSSAGDFGTITLDPGPGWVVYGHHDDVLTYVAPHEMSPDEGEKGDVGEPDDMLIGLHGRSKRDRDGKALQVIHVEDRRPPTRSDGD